MKGIRKLNEGTRKITEGNKKKVIIMLRLLSRVQAQFLENNKIVK